MTKVLIFFLLGYSIAQAKVDRKFEQIMAERGNVVGNGGDVVFCPGEKGITLLDYFEAETLWQIKLDLGEGDYRQKVINVLNRLQKISETRAKLYKKWFEEFEQNARFIPNIVFQDISDSSHVGIPHGCRIEQVAIQRTPQFDEDRRYLISKDIWDQLDEDSKAGLILHELIYREAINEFDHTNSIPSRYFNAKISSDQIENWHQQDLYQIYLKLPFWNMRYQGVDIQFSPKFQEVDQPKFYSNHNLKSAFAVPGSTYQAPFGEVVLSDTLSNSETSNVYLCEFYKNGNPRRILLNQPAKLKTKNFEFFIQDLTTFRENGTVSSFYVLSHNLKISGQEFEILGKVKVSALGLLEAFITHSSYYTYFNAELEHFAQLTVNGAVHLNNQEKVIKIANYNGYINRGKKSEWLTDYEGYWDTEEFALPQYPLEIDPESGAPISFYYKTGLFSLSGQQISELQSNRKTELYSNLMPKMIELNEGSFYHDKIQHEFIAFKSNIGFYPSGKVKFGHLNHSVQLKLSGFENRYQYFSNFIALDEEGLVTSGY